MEKHAGTDKVSGSKTADMRSALVDYFSEEGEDDVVRWLASAKTSNDVAEMTAIALIIWWCAPPATHHPCLASSRKLLPGMMPAKCRSGEIVLTIISSIPSDRAGGRL